MARYSLITQADLGPVTQVSTHDAQQHHDDDDDKVPSADRVKDSNYTEYFTPREYPEEPRSAPTTHLREGLMLESGHEEQLLRKSFHDEHTTPNPIHDKVPPPAGASRSRQTNRPPYPSSPTPRRVLADPRNLAQENYSTFSTTRDSGSSTQPFPPGYVEARLAEEAEVHGFPRAVGRTSYPHRAAQIYHAQRADMDWNKLQPSSIVPHDSNFRVLLLPKVDRVGIRPNPNLPESDGFDHWVDVNEEATHEGTVPIKLLVITQTSMMVGFTVTHDKTSCIFYFDYLTNGLILLNESGPAIRVRGLDSAENAEVKENGHVVLSLGIWAIDVDVGRLIELQVLERKPWTTKLPLGKRTARSAGIATNNSDISVKKTRLSTQLVALRTRTSEPVSSSNALLRLDKNETINIETGESGYQIKRLDRIAENLRSAVWKAEHSKIPGGTIAVKIIKPENLSARNTIRASMAWIKELTMHSAVKKHPSIVQILGADARFLSIYTEYLDAQTLYAFRGTNDEFNGGKAVTSRTLKDISSALAFLHADNIIHNDVKLLNILYSPVRGPILIDFGLSSNEDSKPTSGGTPWYLPPELLAAWDTRGPLSDMWALGVVMMWLLGYIPLPEKTKGWNIRDLHPDGEWLAQHSIARNTMLAWVNLVKRNSAAIGNDGNVVEKLVKRLTEKDPVFRIDSATLARKCAKSKRLNRL